MLLPVQELIINSRKAIAGAIIGLLLVLITIKNIWIVLVWCLLFLDLFTFFRLFHDSEKSNWIGDFNHVGLMHAAKKQ